MSDSPNLNERLAALPKIDELFEWAPARALVSSEPRPKMLEAFRIAVANVRSRWRAGDTTPFSISDVEEALGAISTPRLRPVINATGVVLHTNLGRAPLAARAVERIAATAGGYLNLEFDLEEGERGDRSDSVRHHLTALTGAQDALVVNNCAGAVLLALSAIAKGKEAIVSRGELVEIGGAFRIPEVMEASGAKLKEVGTTNRTRASDYAAAISESTGALLKVHRSNFAIVGFTEEASVKELATIARAKNIPLMVDLGSGALTQVAAEGAAQEPTVREHVASGAHVVIFSGDKLLGGPQAGVLVGDASLIERIRKHPLARAVRADKLTLLALEATLELYRAGREAEIPARAMVMQTPEQLRRRAEKLQILIAQSTVRGELVEVESRVGGGALPLAGLSSWAVAVIPKDADGFCQRLRTGEPAVAARLRDGVVYFDVRCIEDAALESLSSAVAAASNYGGP